MKRNLHVLIHRYFGIKFKWWMSFTWQH